ncbi:hypothetical protein VSU19_08205 [Verrucomicrobiales bacterium BCK34]|nr:hypothetical protein [Verrucomicrobiales bacterium BCK34]
MSFDLAAIALFALFAVVEGNLEDDLVEVGEAASVEGGVSAFVLISVAAFGFDFFDTEDFAFVWGPEVFAAFLAGTSESFSAGT